MGWQHLRLVGQSAVVRAATAEGALVRPWAGGAAALVAAVLVAAALVRPEAEEVGAQGPLPARSTRGWVLTCTILFLGACETLQ